MAIRSTPSSLKLAAAFNFKNYLTSQQQLTFNTLDEHLKECISTRLLASRQFQDLTRVRLTLDIVASCTDPQLHRVVNSFFLAILNAPNSSEEIIASLAKLRKICQLKDGASSFFKCASTKKGNYYSFETLKKIIDQFSSCIEDGSSTLPPHLRAAPPEDEQKGDHPTPTQEPAASHPSLDELLTKNSSFQNLQLQMDAYFTHIPEAHRLKLEAYRQFAEFLENEKQMQELSDQAKCFLLKVAVISTIDPHHPISHGYTIEDLKELAETATKLQAVSGDELLLLFFQGLIRQKKIDLDKTIQVLKFLQAFSQDLNKTAEVLQLLEHLEQGKINLDELIKNLENLISKELSLLDSTENIEELMRRFAGNDPLVKFPMDSERLKKLAKVYEKVQKYCAQWQHLRLSELINKAFAIQQKGIFDEEPLAQLVAIGRLALRIKFYPIYLHPTQVLTALGLLAYQDQRIVDQQGCIAEVKTGEGKTMIFALFAFVITRQGRDFHFISCNQSLAKRDQTKFSSFFTAFGITSSHICRRDRKPQYFNAQILYGTSTDYEFAIMDEMLRFTKLFPRPFENAVALVDEADNLTIDTAQNGARFGFPAEITFNWVYLPVFKFLQQNISKNEKQKIESLQTILQLRTFLQQYQNGQFRSYVRALSNERLQKWLQAAYKALYELEINKQYIVKKCQSSKGLKLGIEIVDAENTGKLMQGCRWSHGLHEFVEIKHDIPTQDESITPIHMTHPVFYRFYPVVYGLTGTIGSKSERDEIQEVYGMSSFDVPTHKPSLRQDFPPRILKDNAHLLKALLERIATCRQQGRPILVVCSTIHDTEILEKELKARNIPHEMLNEKQQKTEEAILENAGLPGAVTIATNNAGRGTDIKLKGNSSKNGGLLVCGTFYPESLRVEMQLRGRSGRQGEPGSSEILISAQTLELDSNINLDDPAAVQQILSELAQKRDFRNSMLKHIHICRADLERFSFRFVKQFFQRLQRFNQLMSDPRFLDIWSKNMSNRLLSQPKPDFSILSTQDRLIAEEAFKLLQEAHVDPTQWAVLLKKAGERVKDKIINEWAISFHAQVEELMRDSKIEVYSHALTKNTTEFQQLLTHPFFEQSKLLLEMSLSIQKMRNDAINEALNTEVKDLKRTIQLLYETLQPHWDRALDNQGLGIIDYLGELLGAQLLYDSHQSFNFLKN